jgi:hypothetical protein
LSDEKFITDVNMFARFAEGILNRLFDLIKEAFPKAAYSLDSTPQSVHRISVDIDADPSRDQMESLYDRLAEQVVFLLGRARIDVKAKETSIMALKDRLQWSIVFYQLGRRTTISFAMLKSTQYTIYVTVFRF